MNQLTNLASFVLNAHNENGQLTKALFNEALERIETAQSDNERELTPLAILN